jgi:hypothetical protein
VSLVVVVAKGYRTRRLNWSIWFVLFIWLIWFIWLVSVNQINLTNQIDQMNQILAPHKHDRGKQDGQRQKERAASDPGRPYDQGVIESGSALQRDL